MIDTELVLLVNFDAASGGMHDPIQRPFDTRDETGINRKVYVMKNSSGPADVFGRHIEVIDL